MEAATKILHIPPELIERAIQEIQAQCQPSPSEIPIRKDIAPEVFTLACQYYAQQIPCYSVSDLMEAATKILQIPPELIERAIQEIQTQRQPSPSEIRLSEDIASEVFTLDSQYYAEKERSYSLSDLIEAGAEVQIPPELILRAIKEIQARPKPAKQSRKMPSKPAKQPRKMPFTVGVGGILAAIVLWSGWTYNSLSIAESNVDLAWVQVENQLQKQARLIPDLLKATQTYDQQEREPIIKIVESYLAYLQASNRKERLQAITTINLAVNRFSEFAASNRQWRSSQLYNNLRDELTNAMNGIAIEQMSYDEAANIYNQKIEQFPNFLLVHIFGFQKMPLSPSTGWICRTNNSLFVDIFKALLN
ncbi:MAG: LemA family protein [Pleurocapsa sp. MO_226.B13]|nr:LemA family protein [Pleurocapsa sp. MO_226.B13]